MANRMTHKTTITLAIEPIWKMSGVPFAKLRVSQTIAGGQDALHWTEECGINGVKNKAKENAVSKARTQARPNRLDLHHV